MVLAGDTRRETGDEGKKDYGCIQFYFYGQKGSLSANHMVQRCFCGQGQQIIVMGRLGCDVLSFYLGRE